MYLFCVFVFWLQKCRFERLEVHQTCIYSKKQHFDAKSAQHLHILKIIKSFDSEKSPNLHILKKIKKIKNQVIYASESHIESEMFVFFDFFEYMQVWWLFTIKTFDLFEYMQALCIFGIKMLFFWVYAGLVNLKSLKPAYTQKKSNMLIGKSHQTCIYSKKINILMPKVHKTGIYSKIIKSFDSEKSPNLHILKKIKKIKNQVIYASESHIESEIFDFFDFLSLCRFGDFSLSKLLIFLSKCRFCALLASKCWFFWVYAGLVNLKSLKPAYTQKTKHFDREKLQNLHILKNIKKIKNQVIYASDSHIESEIFVFFWFFLVYAGLVTFHYQNFWFFWVYAGVVHFWHQNVDFFWVYAGYVHSKQNNACFASYAGFGEV